MQQRPTVWTDAQTRARQLDATLTFIPAQLTLAEHAMIRIAALQGRRNRGAHDQVVSV